MRHSACLIRGRQCSLSLKSKSRSCMQSIYSPFAELTVMTVTVGKVLLSTQLAFAEQIVTGRIVCKVLDPSALPH